MQNRLSLPEKIIRPIAVGMALAALLVAAACTQQYQPAGPSVQDASLEGDHFIMPDGYSLRARITPAEGETRLVAIALHGINDYGHAWREAAARWAGEGIATYAYDQRGFGANANPGIWPTSRTLSDDLAHVLDVVRTRNPGLPVYLVGESMGGAVVMNLLGRPDAPDVDGAVLSAPAVWARPTMSGTYSKLLAAVNSMVPGMVLRGNGLGRRASDNTPMLIELGKDPLVIKGARIDAIDGLVDLMDKAYAAAPDIEAPVLLLYGERDEIVPKHSVAQTLQRFGKSPAVGVYKRGWHMLFRDFNGPVVQNDVGYWMLNGGRHLPSGAHDNAEFLAPEEDGKSAEKAQTASASAS
ncbi:MAG: alpha/beta fold hydrolase [Minwuia sp.]|uniref:alpha/beta fold hydrolase n=1 Tax=Minwuia sp. TaxID=2493630 RepID=UPI003A83C787